MPADQGDWIEREMLKSGVKMPGTIKPPSQDQAVRILRAKAAELEHIVALHADPPDGYPQVVDFLRADIALIATLLADFMEYVKGGTMVWGPTPESYRTKSGRILTDDEIEALAQEAEAGYDVADLTARNQERLDKLPYVSFDKYVKSCTQACAEQHTYVPPCELAAKYPPPSWPQENQR